MDPVTRPSLHAIKIAASPVSDTVPFQEHPFAVAVPSPNSTLMLRPSGIATLMLEGSPAAWSGWVRDLNTAAHLRSSASAAPTLPAPDGGVLGGKATADVSAIVAQTASARREYRMVRTIRQSTSARVSFVGAWRSHCRCSAYARLRDYLLCFATHRRAYPIDL